MLRRRVWDIIRHQTRCYSSVPNQQERREMLRTPVADELVSQYGNKHIITKIFASNPELKDSDIYFWKTFNNVLAKFGFHPRDCFRIIGLYPSVLGYDEEKLEKTLYLWFNTINLPVSDFKFLMINRPEFLLVSPKSITKRIPYLLSYSPSKDTLMTFLFLCPNVMTDDWDEVVKKLEFLNNEMVVYKSEILTCRAMSKPLEFIKMRFSIVEKCGVYIRPNKYSHKQTHKERLQLKNPKLSDITDKSDVAFAKKIAKISAEEYEVYSDVFSASDEGGTDDDTSDESDEE